MIFSNTTILDIDSFLFIPIETGAYRSITKRASSGLVFSPNGISNYCQGDKVYVSDNSHVLYLPEAATYSIKCIQGDICPLINFRCNSGTSEIMSFPTENSQLLLERFDDFARTWIFNEEKDYYNGMAFLYGIFAALSLENSKSELRIPGVLKKALDFMHANYTNPHLSNDRIAKEVSISTVYFRKLFKKYYNISPIKYIGDIRIQQAKVLLKEQSLSVQEISYAVGFTSIYNFSRAFKKSAGYSPNQYKSMQRVI